MRPPNYDVTIRAPSQMVPPMGVSPPSPSYKKYLVDNAVKWALLSVLFNAKKIGRFVAVFNLELPQEFSAIPRGNSVHQEAVEARGIFIFCSAHGLTFSKTAGNNFKFINGKKRR